MRIAPTGAGRHVARRRRLCLPAAGLGAACLLLAATVTACSSSGSSQPAAARSAASPSSGVGSYGPLPTFLPTPTIAPDAPVTGSPGHPAVTSQGDVVVARVGGGSVRATVLGPIVPGEGLPQVQEDTTATWTVTLSDPTTTVPVRAADFVALDEDGHIYHPQYVPGAPRPSATLQPGQHSSFQLRVVIATGEGVMRWQPNGQVLAVWDFVVEND